MRYFSTFSGIGGFELGIGNEHECVGFSEIDKYAVQIYKKHFPNHKNYGDITKINPSELPDFDLLVGGFPCQAFSIAGKRGGFDDTRGTLFFEIARIVREKQPRLLLLENVKGLLSHDKGRTFATIISTLDEMGYDAEWQVLNSKNHGVPQNRERVFIIGHLRGTPRPKIFPFGCYDKISTNPNQGSKPKTKHTFSTIATNTKRKESNYIKQINYPKHSNDRVYDPEGLSPTLNTMQGGNRQPFILPVLTPDRLKKRQNGRRFKKKGEPSFTLTAQDKHGVYNGESIRRLTPVECARLQGFPDNWHDGLSDTQAYKCYGNAVTTKVIKNIIKRLSKIFSV